MKTFPIMLDIHGRRVVVVGGGTVGARRAKALLEAGAQVVLVSKDAPDEADLHGISIVHQSYHPEFLDGAFLVFACTDDRAVNARIARDAHAQGAIVNVADQPEDCDFYLPAVLRDGDVVVAVGTGGTSPALAGNLKDALAVVLPPRIGEFTEVLNQLRETLKSRVANPETRMEIVRQLSGDDVFHEFLSAGPKAVEDAMNRLLAEKAGK